MMFLQKIWLHYVFVIYWHHQTEQVKKIYNWKAIHWAVNALIQYELCPCIHFST